MTILSFLTATADPSQIDIPEDHPAFRDLQKCVRHLDAAGSAAAGQRDYPLTSATRFCERAAKKDASLDLSVLWGRLRALRAEDEAREAAAVSAREASHTLDSEIERLSVPIDTTWTSPADGSRIDAALEAYRAGAERVLTGDPTPEALTGLRLTLEGEAARLPRFLADLDAALSDQRPAAYAYHESRVALLRWRAGTKLFPEHAEIRAAAAAVEEWVSRHGGLDGIRAAKARASSAAAERTRMPEAALLDAEVEAQVRKAFLAQGWGEEILKIRLASVDWTVETQGTGTVVGRSRDAWIAARKADGTTVLYDYTVFQDRSGSGWGPARRRSHASRPIAAANIPPEG